MMKRSMDRFSSRKFFLLSFEHVAWGAPVKNGVEDPSKRGEFIMKMTIADWPVLFVSGEFSSGSNE